VFDRLSKNNNHKPVSAVGRMSFNRFKGFGRGNTSSEVVKVEQAVGVDRLPRHLGRNLRIGKGSSALEGHGSWRCDGVESPRRIGRKP
jgi:hypothetical protein